MKTEKTISKETDKSIDQIFTYLGKAQSECRYIMLHSKEYEMRLKYDILDRKIHELIDSI